MNLDSIITDTASSAAPISCGPAPTSGSSLAPSNGELVKRGSYLRAREWEAADAHPPRHLIRADVARHDARRELPFAGATAALRSGGCGCSIERGGLPGSVEGRPGRSEPGGSPDHGRGRSAGLRQVDGQLATDVARTAVDVARSADFITAIGTLDWALWRRNPHRVSREQLAAELEKLPGTLRRRFVERAIVFASPLGLVRRILAAPSCSSSGTSFRNNRSSSRTPRRVLRGLRLAAPPVISGFGKYLDRDEDGGDPAGRQAKSTKYARGRACCSRLRCRARDGGVRRSESGDARWRSATAAWSPAASRPAALPAADAAQPASLPIQEERSRCPSPRSAS